MNASWLLLGAPMIAVPLGIIFLSFISEDAATVSSALLLFGGPIAWPLGFVSCFLGIWVGDLGLYSIARWIGKPLLRAPWLARFVDPGVVARVEKGFAQRGMTALLISRFVPGMRLPTYLAAGLMEMSAGRFALVTAIGALVWIGGIFGLTRFLGTQTLVWFSFVESKPARLAFAALILVAAAIVLRNAVAPSGAFFRRWAHWEFWPAWLFYLPVGVYYLWLALRYRSFSLPAAANPGIPTGGLIGESKCEIIDALRRANGNALVADAYLLEGITATDRLLSLHRTCRAQDIGLPFILKPDFGQRGNGVKLIRSLREALVYLEQVSAPVIVQRYARGPNEVGIFYYRFPNESRGKIFAITDKIFPSITGDGVQTIAELIAADARARLIAPTYLRRFEARLDEVLARGVTLKLVETGNHAQGCIFRDGAHLWTPELEDAIDRVSCIPGFHIGRYDIRYANEGDLKRGENFQIVELNGASAEATNIYDERNSLWSAYRTLFAQWRLVFAIGAVNRARGHGSSSLVTLWREWHKYSLAALSYPAAD